MTNPGPTSGPISIGLTSQEEDRQSRATCHRIETPIHKVLAVGGGRIAPTEASPPRELQTTPHEMQTSVAGHYGEDTL